MRLRSLAVSAVLFLTLLPSAPASTHSLRTRLTARLEVPDIAVLTAAAGILLLVAECNLPGALLPGATGLTLLLAGIYGLSLHPLRPAGLLLLLTSVCLLVLATRSLIAAFAGTLALIAALLTLTTPPVHLAVAIPVGLVLGAAATLLGRIAVRARRNKAIHSAPGTAAVEE